MKASITVKRRRNGVNQCDLLLIVPVPVLPICVESSTYKDPTHTHLHTHSPPATGRQVHVSTCLWRVQGISYLCWMLGPILGPCISNKFLINVQNCHTHQQPVMLRNTKALCSDRLARVARLLRLSYACYNQSVLFEYSSAASVATQHYRPCAQTVNDGSTAANLRSLAVGPVGFLPPVSRQ